MERARASLFFLPVVFVIVALGTAAGMLQLDAYLGRSSIELPMQIQTTPESARSLLGTIASATITVAGVIFAITLVSIQLAASQFSPRVIPGFLRDSRQQRVMGLAVGTFAYSLVVLRAVRGSASGAEFVPHLSSALSLALAILTIVALIAFLDRSARTMQVGHIVHHLTSETTRRIRELYATDLATAGAGWSEDAELPATAGHRILAAGSGWVCDIDVDELLRLIQPKGVLRLDIRNGSFVAQGQVIGEVWPVPEDPRVVDAGVNGTLLLGDSRILLRDVAFGIRQLVDIGLRALSPGVNDPTTAYDVIVHLGVVVRVLLWMELPPHVRVNGDRRLVVVNDLDHDDYVNRAFDQIRQAGAGQSAIAATLVQTLGTIAADLERDGLGERADALHEQISLTIATFEAASPLPQDLVRLHAVVERQGGRPRDETPA